jgi:CHAD domain-containing protein
MNNQLTREEAKTFGDWAYIALTKHFNKILKHEAEVLKDRDPEELHQMRVGMRRLRSAIAGFNIAIDLPKEASEKTIGKVARILGELRDLDVLKEVLETQYQPNLPEAEGKHLNAVLKKLEKQRKKAFSKVQEVLESELYKDFKKAFKKWLDKPQYQAIGEIAISPILPDLLLPQVSRLLLHPGWLIGVEMVEGNVKLSENLDQNAVEDLLAKQGKILHDLRKEAKRTRYNMELFTEAGGRRQGAGGKDYDDLKEGEVQGLG